MFRTKFAALATLMQRRSPLFYSTEDIHILTGFPIKQIQKVLDLLLASGYVLFSQTHGYMWLNDNTDPTHGVDMVGFQTACDEAFHSMKTMTENRARSLLSFYSVRVPIVNRNPIIRPNHNPIARRRLYTKPCPLFLHIPSFWF
jgi:hypothetical protein